MVYTTELTFVEGTRGNKALCWDTTDPEGIKAGLSGKYGSKFSVTAEGDGDCASRGWSGAKAMPGMSGTTTRFNRN